MIRNILNVRNIKLIGIELAEPSINQEPIQTKIILTNKDGFNQIIRIEGDHTKQADIIEQHIINIFNSQLFFSITKLKVALLDRIKQAQKVIDDYEQKD